MLTNEHNISHLLDLYVCELYIKVLQGIFTISSCVARQN